MTSELGIDLTWETVKTCPLCHSPELTGFESVSSGDRLVTFDICRRCTLVIQNPRMSDQSLRSFYEDPYREEVQGDVEPTEKDLAMQRARALWLTEFLINAGVMVESHLDLGSSTGAFLQETGARFGARVQGVEPGGGYRSFARQAGVPTVSAQEEVESGSRFGLVSQIHVLEHLLNPVQTLTEIRENRISEDGLLLVEVPNLLGHNALELAHLSAFHAWTLRWTLQKAGFEALRLRVHGSFRSPILGLYITALARVRLPLETVPRYMPGPAAVRLMRKMGSRIRSASTSLAPDWTWQDPQAYIDRLSSLEVPSE